MQFKHKLSYIALDGVFVVVGLLGMASISLAQWTQRADMPTARCTFSTGVVNERIYAIGGAKGRTDALRSMPLQIVEEYYPATDTWTRKADMPTARNALCVSVVDGRIYAIGGSDGIATPLGTVEEYNPATDTWTRKADMPTARYALSTSAVNGKIYAIGGSKGGNQALSTVEQYDPVTDIWTKKTDMPTARIHVSTSVVDGKIYAIGGVTGTSASASRSVEQYDPATDTWTRKADMPSAGCTLSTSVANGKIYAMGGSSPMPALAPLSTVQEYNPVTDTWTNKADMPTARSGLSTSAVNGNIYAIGGLANPTGIALATVEEYDPASDPTSVEEVSGTTVLPSGYALSQNYPNPFNPQTRIKYELPYAGKVVLKVFNIVGEEICTLVDEVKPAGSFEVVWDGRDNAGQRVASGMYLYRIDAQDFVQTRKMLLLE
jgi:N-acetylneuraminic acid mutarotase